MMYFSSLLVLFLLVILLYNGDIFIYGRKFAPDDTILDRSLHGIHGMRERRTQESKITKHRNPAVDQSILTHKQSPKVQEQLKKRREKRILADAATTDDATADSGVYGSAADINCDAIGATGYACRNYMLAYLNEFVFVNGTYDQIQLPVPTSAGIPQVDLLVTFIDLLEIDVVTGTMTTSLFIDMFWNDEIIPQWNASLTDGIDELLVPNGLLWEPDVQVYNSIGGYFDQVTSYCVFLDPDGSVWWSGRGMFTFSCEFDVTHFPFDSQSCQIQFASWLYSLNSMNISSATMDIAPSFSNLAWEVDSVTAAREVVMQWVIYPFPYGIYTISVTRYSSHYVNTTILPALIITIIVIVGLFVPDHASRLSLCVTGLLTVIAIQWSIAAYIPVSDQVNWLSRFLLMNLSFIAVCAAECYVSGMMAAVKHDSDVPPWVVGLIDLSLYHIHLARLWKRLSAGSNSHGDSNRQEISRETVAGVELKPLSKGSISNSSSMTEEPDTGSTNKAAGAVLSPSMETGGDSDNGDIEYSWSRGSRALDRMSRLLIPVVYAVVVGLMMSDT